MGLLFASVGISTYLTGSAKIEASAHPANTNRDNAISRIGIPSSKQRKYQETQLVSQLKGIEIKTCTPKDEREVVKQLIKQYEDGSIDKATLLNIFKRLGIAFDFNDTGIEARNDLPCFREWKYDKYNIQQPQERNPISNLRRI